MILEIFAISAPYPVSVSDCKRFSDVAKLLWNNVALLFETSIARVGAGEWAQ